jgi:hypothetical protein
LHEHQNAAPADSTPGFSETSAGDNSKCPMDCCAPGHGQSEATLAAGVASPLPVVAQHGFGYSSITFARVGFSSHTDRGPPSLLS